MRERSDDEGVAKLGARVPAEQRVGRTQRARAAHERASAVRTSGAAWNTLSLPGGAVMYEMARPASARGGAARANTTRSTRSSSSVIA